MNRFMNILYAGKPLPHGRGSVTYSRTLLLRITIALIPGLLVLNAADWPRFRGLNGSGVGDAKDLPAEFGKSKNVIWKAAVPPGVSSPVLLANRVFLTAAS